MSENSSNAVRIGHGEAVQPSEKDCEPYSTSSKAPSSGVASNPPSHTKAMTTFVDLLVFSVLRRSWKVEFCSGLLKRHGLAKMIGISVLRL